MKRHHDDIPGLVRISADEYEITRAQLRAEHDENARLGWIRLAQCFAFLAGMVILLAVVLKLAPWIDGVGR